MGRFRHLTSRGSHKEYQTEWQKRTSVGGREAGVVFRSAEKFDLRRSRIACRVSLEGLLECGQGRIELPTRGRKSKDTK